MRRELPRRLRAMRPSALRIRSHTSTASYRRAALILTTGLAAAPLAPLIAPFVGARLRVPQELEARGATVFVALLVFVMLVRAVIRDERAQREAGVLLGSVVAASAVAAHVIKARATLFFGADLLYEVTAVLLGVSALSAALRTEPERGRATGLAADRPVFSPYHELSDATTMTSAWLVVVFWGLVVAGLLYVSVVVLICLSGALGITVLLRIAERVMPSFRPLRYRWANRLRRMRTFGD